MRRLILVLVVLGLALAFSAPVFAQDGQTVHVVAPGENLYRISLRYGVSMSAIQTANNLLNPNLIYVGQQLVIPTGGTPPQPPPTQPPQQPQPTQPPPAGGSTYVVQRGDTLASIASRFGTTYQAIAAANGITNPNLIYVGQQLTIPGGTGTTPPPTTGNPPPPPPAGTGGFELGGHVEGFQYTAAMREAGMTWVKKQLVWSQGQPPSIAQGLIDQANANGFKILLGITGNPGQLGANRTQYIQDYANFVGGVAGLMTNGGAIEVWNEPNIDRQWPNGQISGAAYTEMLRAAYSSIKAANSNVLVISGAPAPTGANIPGAVVPDDIFIRDMANAGAASYMDCAGIHYNEGILPPTARSGDPRGNSSHYTRYYQTMVSLYSGVFPGKQLCFTELGYLTPDGLGPLPANFSWASNTSLQEQAAWLHDAVALARNSGRIRLMIIWNVDFTRYDDDPMAGYAIIRPDGQCPSCATLRTAMGLQ